MISNHPSWVGGGWQIVFDPSKQSPANLPSDCPHGKVVTGKRLDAGRTLAILLTSTVTAFLSIAFIVLGLFSVEFFEEKQTIFVHDIFAFCNSSSRKRWKCFL